MDKCNTNASRPTVTQDTEISYASRDRTGRIIHTNERKIGDLPVLVAETLAIQNTLKQANKGRYSKVIIGYVCSSFWGATSGLNREAKSQKLIWLSFSKATSQ